MRASSSAWRWSFSSARCDCQRPSDTVSAMNAAAAIVGNGRGAKTNAPIVTTCVARGGDTLATPLAHRGHAFMRILILLLLLAVVVSLFSGLYFVYKDKGNSNRAVISLTVRIALSLLVFVLLIVSYYFGWIPSTGL